MIVLMGSPLTPAERGPRLAEVYRAIGPLYRKALRRVEQDQHLMGMSTGVRAVLDALHGEPAATVPTLAGRLDLSRQFVQRMVNEARQSRWLRSTPNPAHRNSPLIVLTPAGRQAIERVIAREHDLMSRIEGKLTGEDVDATLRVLQAMLVALTRLENPGGQQQPAPAATGKAP